MGFEKVTLDIVAKVLDCDNSAEFYNGTLFLDVNQKDAIKVRDYLRTECNARIQMSQAGNQYAIDFI